MLKYWLIAATSATLALVTTPWVRRFALLVGAVDEPNDRRVHSALVPNLGGLAVLAAFLGAVGLTALLDPFVLHLFQGPEAPWAWILAGTLLVVAAGVADDLWELSPLAKLGCQIAAAACVLLGGQVIAVVTNPLGGGIIELGWLSLPLTLLWIVGITNAFNLIDGLDGLAAGVALIAAGTLFVVSLACGRVEVALLAATLVGALAGFLYYNFHPASVFLGDSGSMLLGYLLAVLSMRASQKGATAVVILVPILSLGLPIMDTLLAMLRRLLGALRVVRWDGDRNEYRFLVLGSASVFRADREHIHHRLLGMGLTHRRAVLLLYVAGVVFGLTAFLAVNARGPEVAVLVALIAVATYLAIRKLAYREVEVLRRGTLLPLFEIPVLSRRSVHALADAGFLTLAYVAGVLLVHGSEADPSTRQRLLHGLLAVVAVKLGVFLVRGVYERSYRYANVRDALVLLRDLVVAEAAALLAAYAISGFADQAVVVALLDFYFSVTLVLGARVSYKALRMLAQGEAFSHSLPVLIYGAGTSGTTLLRETHQNPNLGYRVVGFVDDLRALWGRRVNDVPVLGGCDRLDDILHRTGAREVIVASPKIAAERLESVASVCAAHGIELKRFRMRLEGFEAFSEPDEELTARRAAGG